MAGRKDDKYFKSFIEMVGYSCDAAVMLKSTLENYDPDLLESKLTEMHAIEDSGDVARHVMVKKLAKEFITPIEREDIMELAEAIDTVTDKIEDVLLRMYMFNIKSVNKGALKMADIIVECTQALKGAIEEFANFRKSKSLHEKLIEINNLEEEGDNIYQQAVRELFTTSDDPVTMFSWNQTLHYMEDCCDACEDASDVIEGVILKNS